MNVRIEQYDIFGYFIDDKDFKIVECDGTYLVYFLDGNLFASLECFLGILEGYEALVSAIVVNPDTENSEEIYTATAFENYLKENLYK